MRVRSSFFHFGIAFDVAVVGTMFSVVGKLGIAMLVVGVDVGVEIVAVVGVDVGVEIDIVVVVGVGVGEVVFVSPVVVDVVGTFVVEHALEIGEFRMVLGRIAVIELVVEVVGVVELVVRFVDDAFDLDIGESRFLLFCSCRFLGVV